MIPANFSVISFPFLGLEVNPPRILQLGPLTAHYYGLIIAVGLVLAVIYCCRRSKEFGLTETELREAFLMAKDIRDKYVIGRMLWDFGILEEFADAIEY